MLHFQMRFSFHVCWLKVSRGGKAKDADELKGIQIHMKAPGNGGNAFYAAIITLDGHFKE